MTTVFGPQMSTCSGSKKPSGHGKRKRAITTVATLPEAKRASEIYNSEKSCIVFKAVTDSHMSLWPLPFL